MPKPDVRYEQYIVFRNLLSILKKRGYDLRDLNRFAGDGKGTYDAFLRLGIELPWTRSFAMRRGEEESQFARRLDLYIQPSKGNDLTEGAVTAHFKKPEASRGDLSMLIVFESPKDVNYDVAMGYLEVMCFQQLLFDPTRHAKAPISVEKLTQEQKQELLSSPSMKGLELVAIKSTDPMVLFHAARSGDVLRYRDARVYTGQAITTVEYKMVE